MTRSSPLWQYLAKPPTWCSCIWVKAVKSCFSRISFKYKQKIQQWNWLIKQVSPLTLKFQNGCGQTLVTCFKKIDVWRGQLPYLHLTQHPPPKPASLHLCYSETSDWNGQKIHSEFSISWYGKIQTNFLANPVFRVTQTHRHTHIPIPWCLCPVNSVAILQSYSF